MSSEPDDNDDDDAPSILEQAKSAKMSDRRADGTKRTRHLMTGAAIGVGSAALVAALLYANRSRKSDKS